MTNCWRLSLDKLEKLTPGSQALEELLSLPEFFLQEPYQAFRVKIKRKKKIPLSFWQWQWKSAVWCCALLSRSVVSDSATPWTVACQAPLSMGISQARILKWVPISHSRGSSPSQESNSGLPHCRPILYQLGLP